MSYQEAYLITKLSWLFIKELEFSLAAEEEAKLGKSLKSVKLYLPQNESSNKIIFLTEIEIYKKSEKFLNHIKNYMSPKEAYITTKATWILLGKSEFALLPNEEAHVEYLLNKTKKILEQKKAIN